MDTEFDFDRVIDRRGTDATKYAELDEKFGRSDLLPLWIADMDFATPKPIIYALQDCLKKSILGYTTAPDAFWNSIVNWLDRRHNWTISRQSIDFVPGVKKGLGLCFNYFTRPGDKIVIQPPVYHSFKSVIEGNGRRVINNPLRFDGKSYSMDFEGLRKIIAEEKPAMMIVCNPPTPIGIQWDRATLQQVVDICYDNGILLLSDESSGDMVFDRHSHIPTASISDKAAEITITLGAPSKTFNIPGIATAWTAVVSPKLRDGFFNWLKASEFDTPTIGAIYATIAAYNNCAPWLDSVLAYLAQNADFATRYIADNIPALTTVYPKAGFGLWIGFHKLGLGHDRLADLLINNAQIAVSDGITFGNEGSEFVRLNIGVPRSVLKEALDRIAAAVKSI